MKFKINANLIYENTKALFKLVSKIKDGRATIQAEKESLRIYLQTESAIGVLEFSPEELNKMDYRCSSEGKMTVDPALLKRWLGNFRTVDETIYFQKNKKAGWIIKGTKLKSKRPLNLYDSDIEILLPKIQHDIKLKGDALYEGLKRVESI